MEAIKKRLPVVPFFLFFVFYWVGDAFYEQYLSLYLTTRGLTTGEVGFIFAALYVTAIVASFLLGYISDKLRSPKLVLIFTMAGVCLSVWLTRSATTPLLLTIACLMYGFFLATPTDIADKLVVDHLENGPALYGVIHMGGSMGYLAGAFIAGLILAGTHFDRLFSWSAAAFAATLLSAAAFGRQQSHAKETVTRAQIAKNKVPLGEIFRKRVSYYIYGGFILWGLLESSGLNYASVYLVEMGLPAQTTSYLTASAMVGQMIAYASINRVLDHISNRTAIWAGFALMSFRVIGIALAPFVPLWCAMLLTLIGGMGHPFRLCGAVQIIIRTYPASVSSLAQTLKNLASRGLGSSLGAMLLGNLYGTIASPRLYLGIGAVGFLLALLIGVWGSILHRTGKLAE